MIKKLLLISPLVLLGVAMDIASNSAPASSSGAPDEKDCSTAGCHASYPANSGPGSVTIQFDAGDENYVPGQTYTISVEVKQAGILRFGFQLLALNQNNENAGVLSPIDYSDNQVLSGYGPFAARKYMTYTYKSTEALVPGTGKWFFTWTAPAKPEGKITFYAAGIAANNNGNDAGDYTYTRSLSLDAPPDLNYSLDIFPNPSNGNAQLTYSIAQEGKVTLELINALGQTERQLQELTLPAGKYSLSLDANKTLSDGVYFVRLTANDQVLIKKIIFKK